jgi:hypothetical protein
MTPAKAMISRSRANISHSRANIIRSRANISHSPHFDQRIIQSPRLHRHLPLTFRLRKDFADAAFPLILITRSVDPESVDLDYRKGAIALLGNLDFLDLSLVASQPMRVE